MKEQKIIKDELEIEGKTIDIQYTINNWGKPFDRPLLKKTIVKDIAQYGIAGSEIKKIEVSCSLFTYTDPTGKESIPSMEQIKITVELINGETIEIPVEGFLPS